MADEDVVEIGDYFGKDGGTESYCVLSKIGSGKYGLVYEVQSNVDNMKYAMKMINLDSDPDSANNEIAILSTLTGEERVVQMKESFDSEIYEGNYKLIVLELMYTDLEAQLDGGRILCKENTVKIGYEVIGMLQVMNKFGIYHKDLHAGNLMFTKQFEAMKIADFGLSVFARQNRRMDDKYDYKYDIVMLVHLLMNIRTPYKMTTYPERGRMANHREITDVKATLYENDSLFLRRFVNEVLDQLKGDLNYRKLSEAMRSSYFSFDPSQPFVLNDAVPPQLE